MCNYEKGMSIMTKTQAIEYIMQKNNVSYVVAKVYVETVLGLQVDKRVVSSITLSLEIYYEKGRAMKQMIVDVMSFVSEWFLVIWAWVAVALFFSVVWYDMFMGVVQ